MTNDTFVSWWIKNPIAANLIMIFLIIAGALSYNSFVEKEPFPTVQFPMMQVAINWRGANPGDIEDQIITRIEDSVKDIEGVKEIRSSAWEGGGRVFVRGKERVDRRKFAEDVREKINSINGLPPDLDRLVVSELSNAQPMIRLSLHGTMDELAMNRLALIIRRELSALPLLSSVDIQGNKDEEISIEITEESMRQFGISFDEIGTAIKNSSVNLSVGSIRSETGAVQLSTRSRAEDKLGFDDIILRRSDDGAVLRLSDVASVVTGARDIWRISSFDGENAILFNIMSGDYMDIPRMSAQVKQYVLQKRKSLPEGTSLTIWSDWNEAYQERLSMLFWNAVTGLILVFCLLFLFLQPSVAFWVATGIATAFAATFILMPIFDISLTMLSLFALLMVIGIVVDDAIVIGESIHRANERGFHGEQAAIVGVNEVAKPVIFGVVTTMVVFAPMAFLPGMMAEFTRAISVVVCLALGFSLFEALCILPAHLRHLAHEKSKNTTPNFLSRIQQKTSLSLESFVSRYYSPTLNWCLEFRVTVIFAFLGLLGLGIALLELNYVKQSFMPEITDDKIDIRVVMPEMTSNERVLQVMNQVNTGVKTLTEKVAQMDPEQKQGLIEHFYSELRGRQLTTSIKLVHEDKRVMDINATADELRALIDDIPDAEEIDFSSTLNTIEPRLGFAITASSNQALVQAVKDFKEHLMTYEGVYLVRDNADKGGIEFVFELKPGAEALNVNIRDVSNQIRQAYFGQEVERLPREGGDSIIRLRYTRAERESLETLENLMIRTRDGREIPLMSIVNVTVQPATQRIDRENGKKVARISAEYSGDQAEEVRMKINREFVPEWRIRHPEAEWGLGRGQQDRNEFVHSVIRLEGMAFLVAYMLMAIVFRSYTQPLLLMSAIPFAFVGAMVGHLIHDVDFGMFSLLGLLAASGVVINDNLVLVDCINKLREQGLSTWEATKKAGAMRFRPIILTSLTTFAGLMPMLSAQSVQSKFLVPMVVSLGYGVLAATLTTLLFVPAVYIVATNWRDSLKAIYSD